MEISVYNTVLQNTILYLFDASGRGSGTHLETSLTLPAKHVIVTIKILIKT